MNSIRASLTKRFNRKIAKTATTQCRTIKVLRQVRGMGPSTLPGIRNAGDFRLIDNSGKLKGENGLTCINGSKAGPARRRGLVTQYWGGYSCPMLSVPWLLELSTQTNLPLVLEVVALSTLTAMQ